jgi:hypothetical protein
MAVDSRSSAFPMVFTMTWCIVYVLAVELNLALYTYHPVLGEFGLWAQAPREGPAMYWYGWLATSGAAASILGLAAGHLPLPIDRLPAWLSWAIPICAMLAFIWILHGFFLR